MNEQLHEFEEFIKEMVTISFADLYMNKFRQLRLPLRVSAQKMMEIMGNPDEDEDTRRSAMLTLRELLFPSSPTLSSEEL